MRLALLASAPSLFGYARPALAQMPVFQGEPGPAETPRAAGEPPPPPVAAPAPPAVTASPAVTPAAAPPADAASPLAPAVANEPLSGPVPAKADLIAAPEARRAAEADAEREHYDEPQVERSRWYGWQTLTADGVSLAAILVGAALDERRSGKDEFVWLGILGYELAPGFVHFAHRHVGRGFASFGIRLGMPLAGVFLGASLASGCNTNLCEATGAGVGALLGMGGAIAIDAALFAYDDPKRAAARRVGLVPLVSVTPGQAFFGVGGQL